MGADLLAALHDLAVSDGRVLRAAVANGDIALVKLLRPIARQYSPRRDNSNEGGEAEPLLHVAARSGMTPRVRLFLQTTNQPQDGWRSTHSDACRVRLKVASTPVEMIQYLLSTGGGPERSDRQLSSNSSSRRSQVYHGARSCHCSLERGSCN